MGTFSNNSWFDMLEPANSHEVCYVFFLMRPTVIGGQWEGVKISRERRRELMDWCGTGFTKRWAQAHK